MEMSVHPSPDVQESSRGVAILVVGHNGMKNKVLGQLKSFVALRQGRTNCNTYQENHPTEPKENYS